MAVTRVEHEAMVEEKHVFMPKQVRQLHQHQFGPWGSPLDMGGDLPPRRHPYTCPNRNDGRHFENGGDLGVLVPTI